MQKLQLEISYSELFIIFHTQAARMRRAFVKNLRRGRSFDDIAISRNVIRMRMGADHIFDPQSIPFGAFKYARRRIRCVHDSGLPAGFIADEVTEVPVAVYTNLLEYHSYCLRSRIPVADFTYGIGPLSTIHRNQPG